MTQSSNYFTFKVKWEGEVHGKTKDQGRKVERGQEGKERGEALMQETEELLGRMNLIC